MILKWRVILQTSVGIWRELGSENFHIIFFKILRYETYFIRKKAVKFGYNNVILYYSLLYTFLFFKGEIKVGRRAGNDKVLKNYAAASRDHLIFLRLVLFILDTHC